jgi:hypothetical protein
MEIGPIPGIRAVSPIQSSRTSSDLSAVFRVEFQREREESYTPHSQSAEPGLEDEDADELDLDEADSVDAEPVLATSPRTQDAGRISFIA